MKNKLKTTSFWLGLCSTLVVLVGSISDIFGISISSSKVEDIVMSICAMLICVGFVTKKTENGKEESTEILLEEISQKEDTDNNKE